MASCTGTSAVCGATRRSPVAGNAMRPLAILAAATAMTFLFFSRAPAPAQAGEPDEKKLHSLGAYLSAECASCHGSGGDRRIAGATAPESHGAGGVPNISGLDPEAFIKALKEYRDGVRSNPVMASVARALTESEMAALAAYFHAAGPRTRR